METHKGGTMYRFSYAGNKGWRLIYRVKCLENHMDCTRFGD